MVNAVPRQRVISVHGRQYHVDFYLFYFAFSRLEASEFKFAISDPLRMTMYLRHYTGYLFKVTGSQLSG